jgi:hypothetical protein
MGVKTTGNGMNHWTATTIAVSDAAMSGGGDYYATRTALARFCTEALVEVATAAYVPTKFSSSYPTYRRATRDEAVARLCAWTSYTKLMAWSDEFTADRAFGDGWKPSREVA